MAKFNLLTTNRKLEKNSGYKIMGLNLAPHRLSGYNVCPHAGECAKICIGEHSGFMKMPNVRKAQIRRTKLFFEQKQKFLKWLHDDLKKFESNAYKTAVRLNIDSDLPWEQIDPTLFNYSHIYYDYTKNPRRIQKYVSGQLPKNYHLTFSYNEKSSISELEKYLNNKINVAIVFSSHYNNKQQSNLPATFHNYQVIDGDAHDLRIPQMDGAGVIVGLRAKMPKSKIQEFQKTGFVI